MKTPFAMAAILAPLAGAFAAHHPADESASARAWIAEARRTAQADPYADPAPLPPAPSADDSGAETAVSPPMTDPFSLHTTTQEASAHKAPRSAGGASKEPAAAGAPALPALRLLGILVQQDTACAVLQIDGATHRVRPGDQLPAPLGRVLKITEDAVDTSGAGTLRLPGSGA